MSLLTVLATFQRALLQRVVEVGDVDPLSAGAAGHPLPLTTRGNRVDHRVTVAEARSSGGLAAAPYPYPSRSDREAARLRDMRRHWSGWVSPTQRL